MKKINFKYYLFLLILLTIIPLISFPIYSSFYTKIYKIPEIHNSTLDLKNYDLARKKSIPLAGEWQYFRDKWIVSDHAGDGTPDSTVILPCTGKSKLFNKGISGKPDNGNGSYRLFLKNCPGEISLVSYVPYIYCCYRVYINGQMVAEKGSMPATPMETLSHNEHISVISQPSFYGIKLPEGSVAELVIETSKTHVDGLYMVPILAEEVQNHTSFDTRNIIAAFLVGGLIVIILTMAYVIFRKNRYIILYLILFMNLVVLIRIVFKSEYFLSLQRYVNLDLYIINAILQIISSFMPIAFLYCISQFSKNPEKLKNVAFIAIYEMILSPLILWCTLKGFLLVQLTLCLASYVPFIIPIRRIYESSKRQVPYTLYILAILMFMISSLVSSTLIFSGLLIVDVTLYPPACFFIAVLLQVVLYLHNNFEMQEQALKAEKLQLHLRESRMNLMVSQIQPHFLNNTLIAIHVLCKENPDLAAEAVLKFSTYFRSNMNFMNTQRLIPFDKELEHVKNYASIEKLRFQNRLDVVYKIEVNDFFVPPLSIQPLVENAIRWGASKNIQGGTVILKTYEMNSNIIIQVSDNGPGFDTEILNLEAVDPHGIQNISFRLKEWLDAEIKIRSKKGEGTTVLIYIPRENANENGIN